MIRPHWIRKETNTDDALLVVFAPSTKVCSNISEPPFPPRRVRLTGAAEIETTT